MSRMEVFRLKSALMNTVPKEVTERRDVVIINDWLSTVCVLRNENDRRIEKRLAAEGGGFRGSPRSANGRRVSPTFLAAISREFCRLSPLIAVDLFRFQTEFLQFQKAIMQNLSDNAANNPTELLNKITKFSSENGDFVFRQKNKLSFSDQQFGLRSLIPQKRSAANRIICLQNLDSSVLFSEFSSFPQWICLHFYFVKICRPLVLVSNGNEIFVKEKEEKRVFRIRSSQYDRCPQPTTLIADNIFNRPSKIPSICSESGLSSISSISTATTSPNSWIQKWDLQYPHKEYGCRQILSSIPNYQKIQTEGQIEISKRENAEINNRMKSFQREFGFLTEHIDPLIGEISAEKFTQKDEKTEWMSVIESRIEEIQNNGTQWKEAQILWAIRERFGAQQHRHTKSWIVAVESGRLDADSLQTFQRFLSNDESKDSGFSNIQLSERCDQIPKIENNFWKDGNWRLVSILMFLMIVGILVEIFSAGGSADSPLSECPLC